MWAVLQTIATSFLVFTSLAELPVPELLADFALDKRTEVYQVVVRGENLPTSCLLKTYFSTSFN